MNPKRPPLILLLAAATGLAAPLAAQNPIPLPPRSQPPRPAVPTASAAPAEAAVSASSAPASSAGPVAVASASADYVLSPADSVEMTVFHQADLTTQAKIANDGSVQFPLIGEVKIGGMTLRNAREIIRKRYNADYLVEPQVNVTVIGYAQHKFTILGQVTTPGTYVMPGGEHLGLLEAVGMAGGFTRIANRNTVFITRSDHGKSETIKVNAKVNDKEGQKFELLPGDVVTVKETFL